MVIGELYKRWRLLVRTHFLGRRPQQQSYKAVTVAANSNCCAAARATQSRPLLVCYFPKLPLPGCTQPERCRCEFLEWPDRRIGERRLESSGQDSTAVQRRLTVDRRKPKPSSRR